MIYFLKPVTGGPIEIGTTIRLSRRLKQLAAEHAEHAERAGIGGDDPGLKSAAGDAESCTAPTGAVQAPGADHRYVSTGPVPPTGRIGKPTTLSAN